MNTLTSEEERFITTLYLDRYQEFDQCEKTFAHLRCGGLVYGVGDCINVVPPIPGKVFDKRYGGLC